MTPDLDPMERGPKTQVVGWVGDVKVTIVPMIDGWRVRMNGKLPGTWRATEDGARQAASRWIRHQESKL
jgi:hypothetical protein